jgi:hypothetical protein
VQLSESTGIATVEKSPCMLYWQDDGFTYDEGDEVFMGPSVRHLRMSVPRYDLDGHQFHRVCLLADNAPKDISKLFLGRKVPNRINLRLVKRWIRHCTHYRHESCRGDGFSGP